MFRSATIIRELVLNLAKVIFMLKHAVKLCYLVMGQHDMLPHLHTIYNDVIFTECFNITLAMFNTSSLMMVADRNM